MKLEHIADELRFITGLRVPAPIQEAEVFTDEEGWGYQALAADQTDLHGANTFLLVKPGERVLMHLNLGTKFRTHGLKTWSVKDTRGAKTVGHVFGAVLRNVKFVAREYGNVLARILDEKTVHAWVDGQLVSSDPPSKINPQGVPIKYNPHAPQAGGDPTAGGHFSFVRQDARGQWTIPVKSAQTVYLTPDWKLLAVGIEDYEVPPTKPPLDKEHQVITKYMANLSKNGEINKLQTVGAKYKSYLQAQQMK